MFGPSPQKTAAVSRATAIAREALTPGASRERIALALSELEVALADGGDAVEGETERQGRAVLRELRERARELAHAALDRALRPCPSCGSSALLVSQPTTLELRRFDVDLVVIVCRACGDLRMRCDDPTRAKLAGLRGDGGHLVFREVDLDARGTPYR